MAFLREQEQLEPFYHRGWFFYRSVSLFVNEMMAIIHSLIALCRFPFRFHCTTALTCCHSLPFIVTLCHSFSLFVPLVVIRCHLLSFAVTRCSTCCHSPVFLYTINLKCIWKGTINDEVVFNVNLIWILIWFAFP